MAGLSSSDAGLAFPDDDDDLAFPSHSADTFGMPAAPPIRRPAPVAPRLAPPKIGGKMPPPPPPIGGKPKLPPLPPKPPPPKRASLQPGLPGDSGEFDMPIDPAGLGAREFELVDEGESLELGDFDAELHSPVDDLPAPAHRADTSATDFSGLDIADDEFDLPAPSRSTARDIDLPAPVAAGSVELDLPAPAGRKSEVDFNLPAPVGTSPSSDLPASAGEFADELDIDDLPMPADDDFPAPVDDFPAPVDDFPAPSLEELEDFDDFNTPVSADILPTPTNNLPRAADILPRPADILPTPVETLGLDLDLDDDEDDGLQARATGGPGPKPARPEPTAKPPVEAGKPGVAGPKRDLARYAVYGILGLAVLVVGGGYMAMEMGLFEPKPPPPVVDQGEDKPPPPQLEAIERSPEVLAKFDLDTPAAYTEALSLAATNQDAVGQAEAALLLHYRYGPDPDRLAAARVLGGYPDAQQPFVRRVVGLGLLAGGQAAQALPLLVGEDPRSQLYRAWALLELDQPEDSRKAAEAVSKARPEDRAAKLAVLQARFAANPIDGITAMRQATGATPDHLALQEALMDAALSQGRLGEAAEIGQKLDMGGVSPQHKGEILRRRAGIATTQGRTGDAMRLLEQALASDAGLVAARLDRIQLWLQNKDFPPIRTEVDLLTREFPNDPAVLETAARVALMSGRQDDALEWLAKLGEAGALNAESHDIVGQAHGYANQTAEARAAFAEARKVDPLYWPATLHEAELLIRDREITAALDFLTERQTALTEAKASDTARGRIALAAVARQRAETQREQGQLDEALAAVDEAIALSPADNDALLLRAQLLDKLDRRKEHEEALDELYKRTGGYPGLTEPLGKVLLRKGNLDELDALIGSSLANDDASREILLTGAALRIAQNKAEQAKLLAQKVLDRDPTDSRAHLLVGRALLAEGDYPRALEEIESAQTREGDPEAELWLGQALEYNQDPAAARGHYQRALDLDPNNLEAAALLGRLFAYEGAARKALDLLQPVVDKTNDYPYAWLAIGLAHRDLGHRDDAVESFQAAYGLDASLFEAYYQEGRIHNDQNKHSAAIKALQAGVDNAKDSAQERQLMDAWRRLGESYYETNRRADAKSAFTEYLKLAPANAAGRREVERMLRDL